MGKKTFHIYGRQELIQNVGHFQANQKLERKSIRDKESSFPFILILPAQLDHCFARPQYPQMRMKTILNLNILASQC